MALDLLNAISLGIPVSQNIGRSIGNIFLKTPIRQFKRSKSEAQNVGERDNSTMEHMAYGIPLELVQEKLLYFGRSPPWRYSVIVSDISSGSIYGIYFMIFYSSLLSDILFWHSFLAFYLAPILTSYLASILTFSLALYLAFVLIIYLVSILALYPASLLVFYLAFSLTVYSGILSGIYSDILPDILSGICNWHIFWHSLYSFWHSIWCILRDSLWLNVRQETLWSGACGGGPAGITLIQGLLFGSGGEHCDLERAVGGGGGPADIIKKFSAWQVGKKQEIRVIHRSSQMQGH